jgi:hypothetical protein
MRLIQSKIAMNDVPRLILQLLGGGDNSLSQDFS